MNHHPDLMTIVRVIEPTPGMNRVRFAAGITAIVAATCFATAAAIDLPYVTPCLSTIAIFASLAGCAVPVFVLPSHLCVTVRAACPIRPEIFIQVEED